MKDEDVQETGSEVEEQEISELPDREVLSIMVGPIGGNGLLPIVPEPAPVPGPVVNPD